MALFFLYCAWNVVSDIWKRYPDASNATRSIRQIDGLSNVELCSFDNLNQAFPTRNTQTQKQQTETCFSLAQNVIRIPADNIVNRHQLQKLGSGCKGAVYRAIIQLQHHDQQEK